MRRRRALAAALLGAAVLAAGCGGSPATRPSAGPPRVSSGVPADFIGLVSEDTFGAGAAYRDRTFGRERSAGVRLIRQPFRWRDVERAPGRYDFGRIDAFMASAARSRLRVLPILIDPPDFRSSAPTRGARRGTYPPRHDGDLGRYGAVLARRYGPNGSFWRSRTDLRANPIRSWQVWNEPNLPAYWASGPDPAAYARLLLATARELRRADPHAEVVGAGLSQSRLGTPFDAYVRGVYRAGGGKGMDVFALHPYAGNAAGTLQAVEAARRLLDRLGASQPIWITEFDWASSGPPSPFTLGESGQARELRAAIAGFAMRRKELGIRGAVYYDWRDSGTYPGGRDFFGLHTGLLRLDGSAKPALAALRLAAVPTGR